MYKQTRQMVHAALLLAMGLTLPIAFHSFGMGGPIFLPMHIPVLLGGFILSPFLALLIGALTPILSSILTSMPPIYPTGIQMMCELAVYAFVISYLYQRNKLPLMFTLIIGMLMGRITSGIASYFLLTYFLVKTFSLQTFITATFITGLPGIIIQLVTIPALVKLLQKKHSVERLQFNADQK